MKTHHCQDYSIGSRDESESELSCFGQSPEITHASFSSGEVGVHGTAKGGGVHGTAMAAATSACRNHRPSDSTSFSRWNKHGQKTTVAVITLIRNHQNTRNILLNKRQDDVSAWIYRIWTHIIVRFAANSFKLLWLLGASAAGQRISNSYIIWSPTEK